MAKAPKKVESKAAERKRRLADIRKGLRKPGQKKGRG